MSSKRSRENGLFGGARRRQERDVIDALAEEIATLRDENQRLAREHYRPASASRAASEIRSLAASLEEHTLPRADPEGEENADAAVAIALETEMIRRGLVEVCELLQTMAAQLSASLTNSVPLHEIDRRLRDRPIEADRRRRNEEATPLIAINGNGHDALSNGNGHSSNGNGHHDAIELDLRKETAIAGARNASSDRHLQMIGEDIEAPAVVNGNVTGSTDWWAGRAAVWERAPLKDASSDVISRSDDQSQGEASSTVGGSGYYDRVQRSDGNAR